MNENTERPQTETIFNALKYAWSYFHNLKTFNSKEVAKRMVTAETNFST